jgi:hypothetical protein
MNSAPKKLFRRSRKIDAHRRMVLRIYKMLKDRGTHKIVAAWPELPTARTEPRVERKTSAPSSFEIDPDFHDRTPSNGGFRDRYERAGGDMESIRFKLEVDD